VDIALHPDPKRPQDTKVHKIEIFENGATIIYPKEIEEQQKRILGGKNDSSDGFD
jgi:hypothetical protein